MKYFELYYFMRNHECQISLDENSFYQYKILMYIDYNDLEEFVEIVKPQYECYPKATLEENGMHIDLTETLISDDCDLENFEKCFNELEWQQIKEKIKRW